MNSQKKLQLISCFIAALVIWIPFYVADVHAASLTVKNITGVDRISNFARRTDSVQIEVEASISDTEAVEPGKLRVYKDNSQGEMSTTYTFFDSCIQSLTDSSIYNCIFNQMYINLRDQQTFKVDLHSGATQGTDDATPLASVSEELYLDGLGAKITSLSLDPDRASSGLTTIFFTVEDYAVDAGDTSTCSGISKIDFYENGYEGNLFHTIIPDSHTCIINDSFSYTADISLSETEICAKAYDNFDEDATQIACITFYFDSQYPTPLEELTTIYRTGTDETISYIGSNVETVDITVVFEEEDIVQDSVTADFTNIAGTGTSSVAPSKYQENEGAHVFIWEDIEISSISSCDFDIFAEDVIGNKGDTTFYCDIQIDNDKPEVEEIVTVAYNDETGLYYLGEKSTITAFINEKGVGLEKARVQLDLLNINGVLRKYADECELIEGDLWACYWYDIVPTAADSDEGYYLTIYKEGSKDDLGNPFVSLYRQIVGIDTTSPLINQDVELTIIPGVTEIPYENITIAGDVLEFIIEVSDAYSAVADFSAIGGSEDALPVNCWPEDGKMFCLWEVSVSASGPYDADISFTFEDFTGNKNSITKQIEIVGLLDEPNPDYWDSTVECSPSLLDREVLAIINHKAYCRVALYPNNPTAEIVTFEMELFPDSCRLTNEDLEITDYINNIHLINNRAETLDPYFDMTLMVGNFEIDNLEFTCDAKIFTKVGDDQYVLNPEIEEVTGNLQFYNNAMGTVADNYVRRVDRAKDAVDSIGRTVEDLDEVIQYAEKICELMNMISNAIAALTGVALLIGAISLVYKPFEGLWGTTCEMKDSIEDVGDSALAEYAEYFCDFVNCKFFKLLKKAGLDEKVLQYLPNEKFDVRSSIVWSTLSLCVPGVTHNLMKLKQIQCQYATCVIRDVPIGIPKVSCDQTKAKQSCQFFWGQIFNLIPFLQIFSDYMGIIKGYLSDPASLIGWILTLFDLCEEIPCGMDEGTKLSKFGCSLLNAINRVGKSLDDYQNIVGEGWMEVGNQACEEYESVLEDIESSLAGESEE